MYEEITTYVDWYWPCYADGSSEIVHTYLLEPHVYINQPIYISTNPYFHPPTHPPGAPTPTNNTLRAITPSKRITYTLLYVFQPARSGLALLEGPDLPAPPKHITPHGQHSEAASAHTTRRGGTVLMLGECTACVYVSDQICSSRLCDINALRFVWSTTTTDCIGKTIFT